MSPSPPWRTAFVITSLITRRRSAIRAAEMNGSASSITRSRACGTERGSGATRNVCLSLALAAAPNRIGAEGYRWRAVPENGRARPAKGPARRGGTPVASGGYLDGVRRAVRGRLGALRPRVVVGLADLLPHPAGLRRGHDHAGRDER